MSATFTHQGLPKGTKPFDLLDILHSLRSSLGLQDEDIVYLRYMLTRVRRSDCGKGHICAVWESPSTISTALGFIPRRLNRIETRLENRGLIIRSFTSNRKRFGNRNAAGTITYACGINLGPLLNQAQKLVEYSRVIANSRIRIKKLQGTLKELVQRVRALGVEDALLAAKAAFPRLRSTEITNEEKLAKLIGALEAVIGDFSTGSGQTEDLAASDSSVRLKTDQEHINIICTGDEILQPDPMHTTPDQVRTLASSEFKDAIDLYANISGRHRSVNWDSLGKATRDFAQVREISGAEWAKARDKIGERKAILCFLVAERNASRRDKFRARKIAGAFINMVHDEERRGSALAALLGELIRHITEARHV